MTEEVQPFTLEVNIGELQKKSLFVGLPMYGGVCHASLSNGLMDLSAGCKELGIKLAVHILTNESLIPRARNYIMDEFDRSGFSHMIFIDSDIGFKAKDIIGMLAMMDDDAPYDVLGAAYPKKTISWEKIKVAVDKGFADENPSELSKFVGDYVFNTIDGQGFSVVHPVEMMEIGTGFMMIHRRVLQMFKDHYPSLMYRPDHVRTEHFDGSRPILAYFDCPIDRGIKWDDVFPLLEDLANQKGTIEEFSERSRQMAARTQSASMRYLSEDYAFCRWLRDAGGKVWLAPWIQLEHTGTFVFGGSLQDMARLGVNPTADVELLKKGK